MLCYRNGTDKYEKSEIYAVENFILSIKCGFRYSDLIIVTSVVLRTRLACAVFCPPVFFAAHQVLNNIVSSKKNEQVNKQTCLNVKRCFIFQHNVQIHLIIYLTFVNVSECLVQKMMLAAARLFLLINM